MAIQPRYDYPVDSYQYTPTRLPQFRSAEQFIQECNKILLAMGVDSSEMYGECALLVSILDHYCKGDFDGDLELLLPVITHFAAAGAFEESWKNSLLINHQNLSYPQVALIHYKKLKTENHHQCEIAWDILETIVKSDNDYDSLADDMAAPLPTFRTPEQFIEACRVLLAKGVNPLRDSNQTTTLSEMIFLHYCRGDLDNHLDLLLSLVLTLSEAKTGYGSDKRYFHCIAIDRYKKLNALKHPQSMLSLNILEKVITDFGRVCIEWSSPVPFPPFLSPIQFIEKCDELVGEVAYPNQLLCQKFSLSDLIFLHYYHGDFDGHLNLLLPLIQMLPRQKKIAGSLDVEDRDYDVSYQEVALLRYRQLKAEQHQNTKLAFDILEIVTQDIDMDGCLEISYFEKLASLIRKTQPDPNQKNSNHNGECLMESIFSALAQGEFDDCMDAFPDLVLALLECGGNPNFRFRNMEMKGRGEYINPTCLHVTYLYWQFMVFSGQKQEAKGVKQAFFHLLNARKVDVRAQFTEANLYPFSRHFPGDINGGHIAKGTLAHYALIEGDWETCRKILSLAPDLIGSHCRIVSPLQKRRVEGKIKYFRSIKHPKISLCHIAARRLDPIACTFLMERGAANHISQVELLEYAQLYEKDALQKNANRFRRMHYEKLPEKDTLTKNLKQFKIVRKVLQYNPPVPPVGTKCFNEVMHTKAGSQNPWLPRSTPIVERNGYTLAFDGRTKIPLWGYEDLTRESVKAEVKRKDSFVLDPDIPRHIQARSSDYKGSGFQRGHCAPADNHKCSERAMKETFYLSNMSPQAPSFNGGYWKSFEKYVHDKTSHYDHVHVVTGPLFLSYAEGGNRFVKYQVIGKSEVAVPTHFFKVLSLEKKGIEKRKAYVMPNKKIPKETPRSEFKKNISELEKISGLVFPTGVFATAKETIKQAKEGKKPSPPQTLHQELPIPPRRSQALPRGPTNKLGNTLQRNKLQNISRSEKTR